MEKRKYDMIVAVDPNWAIGYKNDLLYHIQEDMRVFRVMTTGKPVVMGSKTRASLPNGFLSFRPNIVMSRKFADKPSYMRSYCGTDIIDVGKIEHIEEYLNDLGDKGNDCIVIGGAEIYKLFLEKGLIKRVFLTQFSKPAENTDAFIPNLYENGFVYVPDHPMHIDTGYEEFTVPQKYQAEKYPTQFRIRTLIHKDFL